MPASEDGGPILQEFSPGDLPWRTPPYIYIYFPPSRLPQILFNLDRACLPKFPGSSQYVSLTKDLLMKWNLHLMFLHLQHSYILGRK